MKNFNNIRQDPLRSILDIRRKLQSILVDGLEPILLFALQLLLEVIAFFYTTILNCLKFVIIHKKKRGSLAIIERITEVCVNGKCTFEYFEFR